VIRPCRSWLLRRRLSEAEQRDFLWESWRFVKQIFPLLVVGVFIVGVVRVTTPTRAIFAPANERILYAGKSVLPLSTRTTWLKSLKR